MSKDNNQHKEPLLVKSKQLIYAIFVSGHKHEINGGL